MRDLASVGSATVEEEAEEEEDITIEKMFRFMVV